jgi:hypothetical protein
MKHGTALRSRRYTRLETDLEFRARLLTLKRRVWDMTYAGYFAGEALDKWAEEKYGAQRRIVEDGTP